MDSQVIYSFMLYLAFITFPLIPAYIIYNKFPDTQVGANGLLGNLKINATGAFAAYLITCILGFFIIRSIQGNIMNSYYQTWTIKTVIRYKDKNGKLMPLPYQDNMVRLTKINVTPFIKNQDANYVKFLVTGLGKDINVSFSFNSKDFTTQSFDLASKSKCISIDEANRLISIDTVFINECTYQYNDSTDLREPDNIGPLIGIKP